MNKLGGIKAAIYWVYFAVTKKAYIIHNYFLNGILRLIKNI